MFLTGYAILGLVLVTAGAPSAHFVHHETCDTIPQGWSLTRRASPDTVLPLRIGLVQRNLDNRESYLLDVSYPASPNYGKHWSPEKVAETFSPSDESISSVRRWLASEGVHPARVLNSRSGGWLEVNVTVAEAERLLRTEYALYSHSSGAETVACPSGYDLPDDIAGHVDFTTPTLHFDTKLKRAVPLLGAPKVKQADNSTGSPGKPGFGPSFPKTTGKFNHRVSYAARTVCTLR